MRRKTKQFLAVLLIASMVFSQNAFYAYAETTGDEKESKYEPAEKSLVIKAESENTVTVEGNPEEPIESDGILSIQAGEYTIERDYAQSCMIRVLNETDETQKLYMEAENPYSDLSLEIIKSGSKDSPLIINPEESLEIELAVFAQNAEKDNYTIPITAYVLSDGEFQEDAKTAAKLSCNLPALNVSWSKVSEDASTLKQVYELTNNGDALSDLTLSVSKSLESYVSFDPIVSNCELGKGQSIQFAVRPDLAKMKENEVTSLTGSVIASCAGQKKSTDCIFDTQGQEISVTTLKKLAMLQDGNPFTQFELVEDSVSVQYFNGEGYVDVTDDIPFSDMLDENNLFDFKFQSDLDLGAEENTTVQFHIASSVISSDDTVDTNPVVTVNEDKSITVINKIVLTEEEYQEHLQVLLEGNSESENDAAEAEDDANRSPAVGVNSYSVQDVSGTAAETEEDTDNAYVRIVELACDINTHLDTFFDKDVTKGKLGPLEAIYGALSAKIKCMSVSTDPEIDPSVKQSYYALSALKATSNLAGLATSGLDKIGKVLGYGSWITGKLIDKAQELLLDRDKLYQGLAALLEEIFGQQCTNRGKISASFYAPDYGSDSSLTPQLHVSSRMYNGGYVNKTDTNYYIYLNGKQVEKTNNSGLTDVSASDIPTDHLKPGETNTLDFVYDTRPGSHLVNTDTIITLLYPDDVSFGYIGTPDELQDVRRRPDFAVYPENIFTKNELVGGEKAELSYNIYNLGSRGGWFNVTCSEDGQILHKEEHCYLEPFSKKTFTMEWTPSVGENPVTVTITNTSEGLEERDSDNNTAKIILDARERQVPDIKAFQTGSIYENSAFTMTVDIADFADIKNVAFSLDGNKLDGEINQCRVGNIMRYMISSDAGFAAGTYNVSVAVDYKTAGGIAAIEKTYPIEVLGNIPEADIISDDCLLYGDAFEFRVNRTQNLIKTEVIIGNRDAITVEPESRGDNYFVYSIDMSSIASGEYPVKIKMYYTAGESEERVAESDTTVTVVSKEDSYYTFTLDKKILSPEVSVCRYDEDNAYHVGCTIKTEGNAYSIEKTIDMYKNPDSYMVVICHDQGVITQKLSEKKTDITMDGCRTLSFNLGEQDSIDYVVIEYFGDLYIDHTIYSKDTIFLSPGQYNIYIHGYVENTSFYRSIFVDLTEKDQVIDVSDFIRSWYFKLPNSTSDDYTAKYFYWDQEYGQWYSLDMDTSFDSENYLLKCYTTSSWGTKEIDNSDQGKIVISSGTEAYSVQVKPSVAVMAAFADESEDDYIVLKREDLNEVKLVCENEDLKLRSVEVSSDAFYAGFSGNIIYLPDGNYNIIAELDMDSQSVYGSVNVDIEQNCEVIVDTGISSKLQDVVIKWAEQFDQTGRVQCSTNSGNSTVVDDFTSGNILKVEKGSRDFYLNLTQNDNSFTIYRNMDIDEQSTELQVNNEFTGSITDSFDDIYRAGEDIDFYLPHLEDSNGNELEWFDAYSHPLCGNVIFTDTEDSNRVYTIPVRTESNYITAKLPEEAGTYHITVELYTYVLNSAEEHTHTVVIDEEVPATCEMDGLTEGSHCCVCGETIVEQTVIPATGHTYTYTDNADGTHTGICSSGDSMYTEDHVFENHVCTLCNAIEPSESEKPSESESTEESGKPSESESTEESGKPAETVKPFWKIWLEKWFGWIDPEEPENPAETEGPEETESSSETDSSPETEQPSKSESEEESGKPSESESTEESSKPAETVKPFWEILLEKWFGWIDSEKPENPAETKSSFEPESPEEPEQPSENR